MLENKTHSPLKEQPLRRPGESLDIEIQELQDQGVQYSVFPLIAILIAGLEWWRWYKQIPPAPLITSIIALAVLSFSVVRIFPIFKKLANLRQGRDGEIFLGQRLEKLHAQGFRVLHDVPTGRGNIDHILIGPKGIFSIETKTISKPRGKTEIQYDGKKVLVNGLAPDRDPLAQATAESKWIRAELKAHTGRDFPVRGVIVYLGWYVNKTHYGDEIWVLHEDGLPTFLENEGKRLDPEDIDLAYAALAHYERSLR